jgi:hypothetical protein
MSVKYDTVNVNDQGWVSYHRTKQVLRSTYRIFDRELTLYISNELIELKINLCDFDALRSAIALMMHQKKRQLTAATETPEDVQASL